MSRREARSAGTSRTSSAPRARRRPSPNTHAGDAPHRSRRAVRGTVGVERGSPRGVDDECITRARLRRRRCTQPRIVSHARARVGVAQPHRRRRRARNTSVRSLAWSARSRMPLPSSATRAHRRSTFCSASEVGSRRARRRSRPAARPAIRPCTMMHAYRRRRGRSGRTARRRGSRRPPVAICATISYSSSTMIGARPIDSSSSRSSAGRWPGRGPWRASAARRPTACRPAGCGARRGGGTARRRISSTCRSDVPA